MKGIFIMKQKRLLKNRALKALCLMVLGLSSKAYCVVDFSAFGNAPQVLGVSSLLTGSNLSLLVDVEAANFTLSSTNSTAHTAALSGTFTTTSVLTIEGARSNMIYFSDVSRSTTITNVSTMAASVTMKAVDQLSPSVIANASVQQLAAYLSLGLKNPNSYRAIPSGLTTVGSAALTGLTDSDLVSLIPKSIRNSVMGATYSTTLTNAGWLA